jgi:hypothetical protein
MNTSGIYLPPEARAEYQKLAEKTGSRSTRGKYPGPSIAVLLRRIIENPSLCELIAAALNNPAGGFSPAISPAVALRPLRPQTETLAWLFLSGKTLSTYFPEKHDGFNDIVRGVGLRWRAPNWSRDLDGDAGKPADRLAELGHRLLDAGFVVVIQDAAVRAAAASGQYEVEYRRWVKARTKGEFAGWFALVWPWGEDFFKAAMRISGARYDKPVVIVPPEHYAEVEDFAGHNGFQISKGAMKVRQAAREFRERALVVDVPPPGQPLPTVNGRRKLEIPDDIQIDPDLLDDADFD